MTPSTIRPTEQDLAGLDDAELLTLFRRGHIRARAVLHHRHAYMARRMVRHLGLRDPDKVTSQAVQIAIEADPSAAPETATFRERLFATIRRIADQAHEVVTHEPGTHSRAQEGSTSTLNSSDLSAPSTRRGGPCAVQPLD
jgi:hypothetical protein